MVIFLKVFKHKNFKQNKLKLYFIKNNFNFINIFYSKKYNYIFENIFLKNILLLLSNLFFFKINFLLLDSNYNYNYLPVSNFYLKKSFFYKTIKYFNIKVLFFFDIKPRILKNFLDFNLMNISISNRNSNFDFFSKFKNIKLFHYIIYIFILKINISK